MRLGDAAFALALHQLEPEVRRNLRARVHPHALDLLLDEINHRMQRQADCLDESDLRPTLYRTAANVLLAYGYALDASSEVE